MSQDKLGEALGITFQQIQKYEKGTNRIGSSRLVQIAKALDVPVSYFFDGHDGPAGASDLLSDPEIVELISAFRAIESQDLRRALVGIALIMSGTAAGAGTRGQVQGVDLVGSSYRASRHPWSREAAAAVHRPDRSPSPPSGWGPHGASKSGFSNPLESAQPRPLNQSRSEL